MDIVILITELIGTAAFAVSGAVVGIKKNMDIFGVAVLGLTAACGGGLIRDIILGKLPPVMFSKPVYALIAVAVSLAVFLGVYRRKELWSGRAFNRTMLIADAAGLGVFTASGMIACIQAGYGSNAFFTIFLGVLTGVGGGLMRDIMAENPPYIFVRHVYACASLIGAVVSYILWRATGNTVTMFIGAGIIVIVRFLAAHFEWSLPKIRR